mmetsp:Transcript_33543/g.106391  ORF Transcript_33543/g.106391 Transcript_33543/m.106391 type:complete len:200 (+) Transcript_33543:296-895(+)
MGPSAGPSGWTSGAPSWSCSGAGVAAPWACRTTPWRTWRRSEKQGCQCQLRTRLSCTPSVRSRSSAGTWPATASCPSPTAASRRWRAGAKASPAARRLAVRACWMASCPSASWPRGTASARRRSCCGGLCRRATRCCRKAPRPSASGRTSISSVSSWAKRTWRPWTAWTAAWPWPGSPWTLSPFSERPAPSAPWGSARP